jgi:hypothetical protein
MNLQQRKELLVRLGNYMLGSDESWLKAKQRAFEENHWFIPEFIDLATKNIAREMLQPEALQILIDRYRIPENIESPKNVGIVMAGNIPLVGFHDLLCVFLYGHRSIIKLSSKDEVLMTHLIEQLTAWDAGVADYMRISGMIGKADAYIATGSNNSSRYFDYYFSKYPTVIRRNRTSVAILSGEESREDLEKLADDVFQFFGLGCRNVTKLYVPRQYDFKPLLEAFRKYQYLANHHKYKNNFDYNLAILILNNKYYMSNECILLVEDPAFVSRIGQLNYEFYTDEAEVKSLLTDNEQIQCVTGSSDTPFGSAQCPGICDFADGRDTMAFLSGL